MPTRIKKKILMVWIFGLFFVSLPFLVADQVTISSLEELAEYAGKSGNEVKMAPGRYLITDYIPLASIEVVENKGTDIDLNY